MRYARDGDPTGRCQRLQSCGNINAVAKEIAALDHHVADMDADTEIDLMVSWSSDISFSQGLLSLYSALHGVYSTPELRQHAIPGSVGDPAPVNGYEFVQNAPPMRQISQGGDLISAHQAAITLYVSGENRD